MSIPSLSTTQIDYATKLQGIMTNADTYGFKPDEIRQLVNDLNNEFTDLDSTTKKWGDSIASANRSIETGVEYSADLTSYLKESNSFGAKFKSIMGSAMATIGNALMSMGISWLISTGLGLIIRGIDNIVHKAEHIKEAADEARQAIQDANSEFENTQKTVSDVSERYAQLAQQVGNLGTANQNQGGLSNGEYQEFLDISNQLAEVFPTLTKGYTDNGDAILGLSGNVDTIVSSLNELVKVEQDLANQKVLEGMDKIWQDFDISIATAKENIEEVKHTLDGTSGSKMAASGWQKELDVFNALVAGKKPRAYNSQDIDSVVTEEVFIKDAFKTANVNYDKIVRNGIFHVEDLTDAEVEKIRGAFQTIKSNYEAEIKGYENEIKKQNFEMGKYVSQSIKTGGYYDSLNDVEQKIAEGYVLNLDYDKLLEENGDWETTFNRIQDKLRSTFEQITPANKALLQKYYSDMFSIDLSEGSYQDNLNQIMNYARLIVQLLGAEFSEFDILQALGLDSAFEKRDTARQKLGYTDQVKEGYQAKRNADIDGFLSSLSSDELDKFNVDFSFDKDASIEEIAKLWDEFQNYVDENPIDPNFKESSAVDSMADMKKAVGSLSDLYNQTVKQVFAEGQATGFADPDLLNNVESAFYKFSEELKKEGNDAAANEINKALEDFEKTLVEFPNDADKAQDAIDNLITKYVDQTDVIKNLKDENKEWSIAQLEAMGITNAEEVVMSRLSKQVKATQNALNQLSKALDKYNNALESGDESAKADAIAGLVDPTKEALTIRDAEGNALKDGSNDFIDNLNQGFVQAHLKDVQAMAEGDVEALNRVRLAAAKGAVMEVTTNVPTEVAEQQIQGLMDMVAQADAMNIEPGASIDDSAFIATLNEMIRSGQVTVEQVNAAFQNMGYEAKWKSNPGTMKVPGTAHATAIPTSAGKNPGKVVTWDFKEEKVDFPSLEIITKKGSSGGGVGAHYTPPSGGSTGGGGDGGGGGGSNSADKDKDEAQKNAAESFDWIAVYIQRIEEEIERLDKDATNVYKNWEDRNKSLAKEMSEVTKQIKAQEVATKEYARNAQLVSATGSVLSEKQAKKLDKAEEAWTDELQKKIIGGKYTTTKKTKKGKTKKVFNTKKLKKDLGDSYNGYVEAAAEELFAIVKKNNKKKKKTKVQKNIIVGNNKPKKSDYDGNTAQYKADLKDWKEAQKVWAKGTYQKKIREGTMTGKDIEDITNKYLVDAINKETEIVQKEIDAKDKIQELRIQLSDLNKQELDNIIEKWDQILEISEKQISLLDTYMNRVETVGYWLNDKFYKEQRNLLKKELSDSEKEYNEAVKKYESWRKKSIDEGGFDVNSEAAREAQQTLLDTYNKVQDIKNELFEIDKKERELSWEKFDWLEEKLEDITNEAQALQELLTLNKTMDDYGFFNERGMANLAMLGTEYEESVRKVQDYAKQREKLNQQLSKNPLLSLNRDFKDEMDKVNEGYRDAYKELASNLQNISSVFKESIDQNLSNLKKMMDEYKSTLSAAKDLYDFNKNLGNQTKNIENLRKQLVAYQSDDSEAARKRRQELTNQLTQAEQQLQETEWDRYISQTGEMLDNLYSDYEENLNSRLDNISSLIDELIIEVNGNPNLVSTGITSIMKEFGIDVDNFEKFTKQDNQKILSGINEGKLAQDGSKILTQTENVNKNILNTEDALNNINVQKQLFDGDKTIKFDEKTGAILVKDVVTEEVKKDAEKNNANKTPTATTTTPTTTTTSKTNTDAKKAVNTEQINALKQQISTLKDQKKVLDDSIKAGTVKGNDKENAKKDSQNIQLQIDNLQNQINSLTAEQNGSTTTNTAAADAAKITSLIGQLKNLESQKAGKDNLASRLKGSEQTKVQKEAQVLQAQIQDIRRQLHILGAPGYATGTKHVPNNQLAWTQEKGRQEFIFRSSDGAMLTPLGQGDMVFTNEMSKRLWEIASSDIALTGKNTKLPNINSNNHSTVNLDSHINITLPNVNDYDSFKRELQNDPKFEGYIQEITIGRAMGNNTLNKRKY